jgi:phosphomevalonate kinase
LTGLSASAPGKLFLSGEYAVLEGAPAVLTAVDRRAVARVAEMARAAPSPVVAAVLAELLSRFPGGAGVGHPAPTIAVGTRGFARGRNKIGIGSSAAVAVAATALLLARREGSAGLDADRVFEIALAAHRAAQGGRGSGADVAAAVHGGTIRFEMGASVKRLGPVPAAVAFVWTGRPASTTELLGRVQAFALAAPAEHRSLFRELEALATALAAAYGDADPGEIVRLTGAYGSLMARLGERAGAPIVSPAHARVARLAAAHGGAGKPSGAGGGDVAMAVFARADDRDRFAISAAEGGLPVLDLRCHERGVEVRGS